MNYKQFRDKHSEYFGILIKNNPRGIVAYAANHITSGKCEGIVNLIKTIRRAGCGVADVDCFFLRLIDATNRNIIRGVS
ncbi:MAG TPA: transposase [Candidatus Avisuccinivibrio pullicola]|nr:transposase [Candidatus Avisuccinivibrio pullicola]